MTTKLPEANWYPSFIGIMQLFDKNKVPAHVGEAILAFALGYARGLQQLPVMDIQTITNINLGWAQGANTEATSNEELGQ